MPAQPIYRAEVHHEGLHKYRVIKGADRYVVETTAQEQLRAWNEIWERKQQVDAKRLEREKWAFAKEGKKKLAAERTEEAQQLCQQIAETLAFALKNKRKIEWELLIDKSSFPEAHPTKPQELDLPREPQQSSFVPQFRWYYLFLRNLRQRVEAEAQRKYLEAHQIWKKELIAIKTRNFQVEEEHKSKSVDWQRRKEIFEKEQTTRNNQVLSQKQAYLGGNPESVGSFYDLVLSKSEYPSNLPHEWNLDYRGESKTLVVDYFLPAPEQLPSIKEVKYIASKDELSEVHLQESAINKMYDALLYQITLRTIYELYEADGIQALDAIVFNGWVRSIDKGTGKPVTACVLSLQAVRKEFQDIDLRHVDPRECFRTLKGVGSSKLHGLSPIAPILQLNKEDKRFVSSYSVVAEVDQGMNLAAMDWEDFEHLIRELFEQEFSQNGGEVKITRASRDGGVDAVAFDPDPIRGGKIVIQAKRYTNVVGVSAVRDLYGTVMNEGATKGILVTTADYGPDSYAFAKGKPLTLLNGGNLLHLLAKYGHKARIDLKAAKQFFADQDKSERA
jgi:restriction system protein